MARRAPGPLTRKDYAKLEIRGLQKGIQISGIKELEQKLNSLGAVAGPEAVEVIREASKEARSEVLSRTPLGPTGNLRRAVFYDARDPYHDPKGPTMLVGVNAAKWAAPHAYIVEFGHAGVPARPYFRPGILAATPKVKAILEAGVKRIVESVTK